MDNAATTRVHGSIIAAMREVGFENYNAKYYNSSLKEQIDGAISSVANLLNLSEESLVFTSGATESNNFIIRGILEQYSEEHFITSTIEHKSVLSVFKYYESRGWDISYVGPDSSGEITLDNVKACIKSNTKLISVMAVNNETGVINSVQDLALFCRSSKILFHCDMVQGFGKVKYDLSLFDYVTLSAHKIFGPKGVGMAIINSTTKPLSLLLGSEQQNGYRSGTIANDLVVAMCLAIELALLNFDKNKEVISRNKSELISFLDSSLGGEYVINFTKNTVDSILSIQILNEINQIFLSNNYKLIAAATGSSCSVSSPSYVLMECGLSSGVIMETIRFSLSPYEDVIFK